jgi:hypothetical protein
MRKIIAGPAIARSLAAVSAACLALLMAQTPARAAADITNFNVKNCTSERVFVCSFDKTDSLMKIPYKAAGIQPGDRKEFGCASLDKCKVIIGVSKRKSRNTLSAGMQAALATGSGSGAVIAATGVGLYLAVDVAAGASVVSVLAVGGGAVGAVIAVGAGAAIASIKIADGWSDGEVCNQVRKAAQNAGLKPKFFLKDGKKYRLIEEYATDKNGNQYLNPDGSAVIAYTTTSKLNSCPAPLKKQIVPN